MRLTKMKHSGFTLVELLAGTTIFAVIMALFISMINSFGATKDIDVSKQRLETIVTRAGEYYISHEMLPLPVANAAITPPLGEAPIADLHLAAKYRLDAWGNPLHFLSVRNDGINGRPGRIIIDPLSPTHAPVGAPEAMVIFAQANPPAVAGKTLLNKIMVNNRLVAAVLISTGPNGIAEYTYTPGAAGTPATPAVFSLNANSDDLIYAIDLTAEATQIALTELKKLGEKVQAFEDRYIGKDNDGDGAYDEDGCDSELYPGGTWSPVFHGRDDQDGSATVDDGDSCTRCPPGRGTPDYLPLHINHAGNPSDYSCGLPTLDDIKATYWETHATYGYYYPQIDCYGWHNALETVIDDDTTNPPTTHNEYTRIDEFCETTPPDYYRVPMHFNDPQESSRCLWGLVGNRTLVLSNGAPNTELTNDPVRAALFCAYGLAPDDIVDPWLNGYVWGCGPGNGQGGGTCPHTFPDGNPRFHKFFSAGPDQIIGTPDDIIAPL